MAHGLLHVRNHGAHGTKVFSQYRILFCHQRIIGRDINIYREQRLILLLQSNKQ